MTVERTQALLTPLQRAAIDRVLGEEAPRRELVAVGLSGAHAWGFPSPTSGLDLDAVHLDEPRTLLGFPRPQEPVRRALAVDGVQVDFTSHELGAALEAVLAGHGRHLEHFLSDFVVQATPTYLELRTLVRGSVSRRAARWYTGEAARHRADWETQQRATVHPLLASLRATLTGTHLLRTGELLTDVSTLLDAYGLPQGHVLITQRARGETEALDEALAREWAPLLSRAFTLLDQAVERTILPEAPENAREVEAFLVQRRLERLTDG